MPGIYSRFPEVEIVSSTSAKATIPKLDAIFARQGIPETLQSDNGPPFNGSEFEQYAAHMGFEHQKVTPLWPRANGEVERFMQTLKKVTTTAVLEKKSLKQALREFLLHYRVTPHSTTGVSPSELLNGRKLKTRLPSLPCRIQKTEQHENACHKDKLQKTKIKTDGDKNLHVKPISLKVGDSVLVKQNRKNATTPPFDPCPYKIVWRKGNTIMAQRGEHKVKRNVSFFFKKILPYMEGEGEEPELSDIDDDPDPVGDQHQPGYQQPRRQPARNRQMLARFKDFVMD